MALTQRRLFRVDGGDVDVDPAAEGVVTIQQHSVFVEIIANTSEDLFTFQQYTAVVGLVKKCREVRNVFDNAVLWFNDQFLFGNKSNRTVNVTPPDAMGRNPNRTHTLEDLLDPNRNNGTQSFNATTGGLNAFENGTGPNEGGNPDRDGFIRAKDFRERWGGCFIPNGFIHAIGVDDPYSTGQLANADGRVVGVVDAEADPGVGTREHRVDVGDDGSNEVRREEPVCDNVCLVKHLIDLEVGDGTTGGCDCGLFTYVGSFFITDPNNHRWIVDEFIYPVDLAGLFGTASGDDFLTNCHMALLDPRRPPDGSTSIGGVNVPDEEDEMHEPIVNARCSRELERPDSYGSSSEFRETDHKGNEGLKLTTKEPLLSVHIQVDPWNPDRQGFPDEAIWAYEDGARRLGMPYTEDPFHFCHDAAVVSPGKPEAYEYDRFEQEAERRRQDEGFPRDAAARDYKWNLTTAPGSGSEAWHEFRRGPVGNTVECAIEYNFLLAFFFEAFDNVRGTGAGVATSPPAASGSVTTQDEGTGENEIIRNYKKHGPTAGDGLDDDAVPDSMDPAWKGNSHPHNPKVDRSQPDPSDPTKCVAGANGVPDWSECPNQHRHDALVLDIFFHPRAPAFTMDHPYWDHYNLTDDIPTAGSPPQFRAVPRDDVPPAERPETPVVRCLPALTVKDPVRRDALERRRTILCDVDAVDGFHLHDGAHEV